MGSSDESENDPMFTDMTEDIHEDINSHPCVNRRESPQKIHDHII